jgi:hypothetical protein
MRAPLAGAILRHQRRIQDVMAARARRVSGMTHCECVVRMHWCVAGMHMSTSGGWRSDKTADTPGDEIHAPPVF